MEQKWPNDCASRSATFLSSGFPGSHLMPTQKCPHPIRCVGRLHPAYAPLPARQAGTGKADEVTMKRCHCHSEGGAGNWSEPRGEHLMRGPSLVTPNQPEQSLPPAALTARITPSLTYAPCQPPPPVSTMMPTIPAIKPDRQPPGHGVLAQAAISRTPPEINGIKWQQMALF